MRSVLIPIAFLATVAAVPFAFAGAKVTGETTPAQYPPSPTPTPTPMPTPTPTPMPTPTPTPTPIPTPTPFPTSAPLDTVWDAGAAPVEPDE